MASPTALVLLANGCEDIESVTIIDVLTRAEIKVITAGLSNPVKCANGSVLCPDVLLSENLLNQTFDVIACPGGLTGVENLTNSDLVCQLLRNQDNAGRTVAAICAAPLCLAKQGVCKGKKATCYPLLLNTLKELNHFECVDEVCQIDGNLITGQGPASAMKFAINVVGVLKGVELANQIASNLLLK